MRAIISKLRRLENTAVSAQREPSAAEAINAARRRRLGADCVEPIPFAPGSFDDCPEGAERILRIGKLRWEREAATAAGQAASRFTRRFSTEAL
jgi:hypothetical protein